MESCSSNRTGQNFTTTVAFSGPGKHTAGLKERERKRERGGGGEREGEEEREGDRERGEESERERERERERKFHLLKNIYS